MLQAGCRPHHHSTGLPVLLPGYYHGCSCNWARPAAPAHHKQAADSVHDTQAGSSPARPHADGHAAVSISPGGAAGPVRSSMGTGVRARAAHAMAQGAQTFMQDGPVQVKLCFCAVNVVRCLLDWLIDRCTVSQSRSEMRRTLLHQPPPHQMDQCITRAAPTQSHPRYPMHLSTGRAGVWVPAGMWAGAHSRDGVGVAPGLQCG